MKKIIMAVSLLSILTGCSFSKDNDIEQLAGKALFIRDYIEANNALKIIKYDDSTSFELIKPIVAKDPTCEDKGGMLFCHGYNLEFSKDMRQNADRTKEGFIDRSTVAYEDCFRITASQTNSDGKYTGVSYTTYITAKGDKPFYDTCEAEKISLTGRKACEKLGGRLNDVSTWTTLAYDVPADKAAQIKRVAI